MAAAILKDGRDLCSIHFINTGSNTGTKGDFVVYDRIYVPLSVNAQVSDPYVSISIILTIGFRTGVVESRRTTGRVGISDAINVYKEDIPRLAN